MASAKLPAPGGWLTVCPSESGQGHWPVPSRPVTRRSGAGGAGAGRKPRLLLRLPGLFLLRLAARQLEALLFQEPPRFTRLSPWPVPNYADATYSPLLQMPSRLEHGSDAGVPAPLFLAHAVWPRNAAANAGSKYASQGTP